MWASTPCPGTVFPECKQDYIPLTAGRVGRPILQSRCSSASRIEPAAPSSSPRKRRGCSTTTTSGPSTCCSAWRSERDGVAGKALASLDISIEAIRRQVEEIVGQGRAAPTGHIPFTPRSKKVLELSLREALQLGHNYIGTEHILLGLIREGEGVATQVLQSSARPEPRSRRP